MEVVLNRRSLVICDRDKDYGSRLADYMISSECGYDVVLYTDPERFVSEWTQQTVPLLLMDEDFTDGNTGEENTYGSYGISADRYFVLTGDRDRALCAGFLYKYQSAANIIAGMGGELKASHRIISGARNNEGSRVIGVYSPVSHVLKTTYSMTLARILASAQDVLYVNLEGFNGLSRMLDTDTELSLQDLIYEYSLRPDDLNGILPKYITASGGMNMLTPARCPYELQEIDPAMWLSFIGELVGCGRFKTIILDISDEVRGTMELLNICSVIHMPVRRDDIAVAKLKDFDDALLRYPGGEGIMSRILRLKFPYFKDMDAYALRHGNDVLGRYIRQEILKDTEGSGLYEEGCGCAVSG